MSESDFEVGKYDTDMEARIQTVLGDISPNQLGYTLTHEHLAMDFSHFYRKPPKYLAEKFDGFSLDRVGFLRQYPYSHHNNLVLNDETAREAVVNDLKTFKSLGGGTIVENSTEGLDRDIKFYKQAALETDVNIVAGTGYYISDMQPANVLHSTVEELYDNMKKEFTQGFDDDDSIRAGFIGEVASVWPIRDFERKAIRAAGELQKELGCGVSFHPHRDPEAPFEIIRLYLEAGGSADKVVMSHLDRTLLNPETLLEFSNLGTYCQFDLFGVEVSYYQLNVDTDMPSDSQRLEMIRRLVDEGKVDKILMSHDIHTKHRLIEYGGHGYSHILSNVLPRMKTKGFSPEDIETITKHNPAAWLTLSNVAFSVAR